MGRVFDSHLSKHVEILANELLTCYTSTYPGYPENKLFN